jgi:cell division protein FtsB
MSTRAAVRPKAAPRKKDEGRPVRLTGRALGLLITVILVLVFAISPMRAYLEQRNDLRTLQQQTVLLQRANQQLSDQITELHDPTYLERLARECLGMVSPGETSFIAVPKNGAPQPPDC